jgi:3-oxoacyl-[acyl-carrier-protein] synthase-3
MSGARPAPSGATITPPTGAPGARILSVGAYLPARIVTNDEVCEVLDSSDQWIRERSGIATRHRADDTETVVHMGARAALQAIERAGLVPADIDAVLVATTTHHYVMPSAAALLTHEIGATPAAAMDVAAACAGFAYGVGLANDMIRSGSAGTVLLVGVDRLTDIIDPADRGTAFIFGDGAGAVVIQRSDTPEIGPTVWGSDGAQGGAIAQNRPWTDLREREAAYPSLFMAGQTVFRWAVWSMAPEAQKALDSAGVKAEDLAAFIPHQANVRIIDALAKQLALPEHVVVARDVAEHANTSAASIPVAMDHLLAGGAVPSGGLALLIGYGSGLTHAAQVVRLP